MTDFLKTLYQILLASIVGGLFAFAWQRRGWIFQQKLKTATDLYEARLSLIKDFFTLVDKRVYSSHLYLNELITNDNSRIDAERLDYRSVVAEWNERVPGLLVMLRGRFDYQTALDFEHYFPPAFANIDQKLRRKRLNLGVKDFNHSELTKSIRGDLHLINYHARDQMQSLFERTKNTLHVLAENPPIDLTYFNDMTTFYLFNSLFKPRSNL